MIHIALEEINAGRGSGRKIELDDQTILLGPESPIESIELVNLIVSTELLLEERHGIAVELAGDRSLWEGDPGLKTVGTFTDHVLARVKEQSSTAS